MALLWIRQYGIITVQRDKVKSQDIGNCLLEPKPEQEQSKIKSLKSDQREYGFTLRDWKRAVGRGIHWGKKLALTNIPPLLAQSSCFSLILIKLLSISPVAFNLTLTLTF